MEQYERDMKKYKRLDVERAKGQEQAGERDMARANTIVLRRREKARVARLPT